MTHRTIREWGRVAVGPGGFTSNQAEALLAAARAHPLSNKHGTNILIDRRTHLYAQQMVGMVAGEGCSLEILPKVDPDGPDSEDEESVRKRLVRMIDIALGLGLSEGAHAAIARQDETLLDVLIRAFADRLLTETRRGLPRQYRQCEEDLPAVRGRLDTTRQFTRNAVRPDRITCRFDQLDSDTPLMRVMAATVSFLVRHARSSETQRKLTDLRHLLADITQMPISCLPWRDVRIDRTNHRWENLFWLARLLLGRHWESTHWIEDAPKGITLLFPMSDLFEAYVAALIRRGLAHSEHEWEVVTQGGLRFCLGPYTGEPAQSGNVFRTKPDIILRRGGRDVAIIDTKWKRLANDPLDKKHGVDQADVYQLMAYARLYRCSQLLLLYPGVPGEVDGMSPRSFGMAGGRERLAIATVDVSRPSEHVEQQLAKVCGALAAG